MKPSCILCRPQPRALLLTEFHAVLAFEHCVKGICLLNQQVRTLSQKKVARVNFLFFMQVVFTSDFDPADGAIRGLSRDPVFLFFRNM